MSPAARLCPISSIIIPKNNDYPSNNTFLPNCFACGAARYQISLTSGGQQGKAGVVFPPHNGGETEIWRFLPPPYFETLGGKFEFLPPHISRPWGGNSSFFPLKWGGNARRRRKILRILIPEMLEILKKNTFPNVKGAQKS